MQFTKIFSMSLSLMVLGATALTTPVGTRAAVTSISEGTATVTSYFTATYCNSTDSLSVQTVSSNTCIDLGFGDTTRSVLINDLVESGSGVSCKVQVYKDEACSDATHTAVHQLEERTCVHQPTWSDGSSELGSLMLVCSA